MNRQNGTLLSWRHRIQQRGFANLINSSLLDAEDEDGDGFYEVHCNTMDGIWGGLRNFLHPFRGIHKKCLYLYVALFEWGHNLRWFDFDFLRRILFPHSTYLTRVRDNLKQALREGLRSKPSLKAQKSKSLAKQGFYSFGLLKFTSLSRTDVIYLDERT
ncbi:MAG: hypothetical protein ACK5CR_18375 [Pseudanabaena sp.]